MTHGLVGIPACRALTDSRTAVPPEMADVLVKALRTVVEGEAESESVDREDLPASLVVATNAMLCLILLQLVLLVVYSGCVQHGSQLSSCDAFLECIRRAHIMVLRLLRSTSARALTLMPCHNAGPET